MRRSTMPESPARLIARRWRLDHGDRGEHVGVERAERRRSVEQRICIGLAVDRVADIGAGQAAQVDRRIARGRLAVDLHARYALQRLADIEVGEAAETVGRDAVGYAFGLALHLQCIGIGFAEAGDDDLFIGLWCVCLRIGRCLGAHLLRGAQHRQP